MDNATSALARMNMILHDCPTAEIWQDNTLSAPALQGQARQLKTFDFGRQSALFHQGVEQRLRPGNDLFGRFEYGIPPAKNGDYAFLLHMLKPRSRAPARAR
jgi:type I restriction enzyme M protein